MVQVYGAPARLELSARERRISLQDLCADVVRGGIIPPSSPQVIESSDPAHPFDGWNAGVYDGNGQVCETSLANRHWTRVSVPYGPDEIRALEPRRLDGEAVYCGLLFHHFGHFLLETTSRLWWPLNEGFEGPLVFQNTRRGKPFPDFALRFFRLLGIAERVLVADDAIAFNRVVVPQCSFTIQSSLHPAFMVPFARAGAAAERDHRWRRHCAMCDTAGLYLSRTRYSKRWAIGERRLEQAFSREGYCVLHMEDLPLEQQILAVRRFDSIAGIAGSAFHNILFSSERKTCAYICKDYNINLNFLMIDEVMQNRSTYIYNGCAQDAEAELPHGDLADMYFDERKLDLRKIAFFLMRAGILSQPC